MQGAPVLFPFLTITSEKKKLISKVFEKEATIKKGLLLLLAVLHVNPMDTMRRKKRVSFICRKQCLTSPVAVPNPIEACKYLGTECGYSTHMSIKAHPRLISEIPRGSNRWKKIRNLRSASERSNGTCKSDLDILESPRIYGTKMASIEATIACITTLLKRVMHFVIRIRILYGIYRNYP